MSKAYPIHPAAKIPPPLSAEDYESLKANIAERGQLDAIVLHKGKVIDGVHRQRICKELGIEPAYRTDDELAPDGDPYLYVFSKTMHRNSSVSQRALMAAEFKPHCAKAAKERQKRKPADSVPATLPGQNGDARDDAATAYGISGRTVDKASSIIESGCRQLYDAVKRDVVTTNLAYRAVKAYPPEELAEVVAVAMVADKPAKELGDKVKSLEVRRAASDPENKHAKAVAVAEDLLQYVNRPEREVGLSEVRRTLEELLSLIRSL